ncbi:gypsy type transposase [Tanacetum coccineum]
MLDNDKSYCVANRLGLQDWSIVFRRPPRGGIKSSQFSKLKLLVGSVVLSDHRDFWTWSLDGSKGFFVASVRSMIDSYTLDVGPLATRWNKNVPIKVNVFLWRLTLNKLPSRMNLDRKGIDVDSLLCPTCQEDVETTWAQILYWIGLSDDLSVGFCIRAREVTIPCTIKRKPLALPWGWTPRLDSGVKDWVCFRPMTVELGPGAQVIVWSKPGGLVYLLYVIKSPQSSMILPADHVLRAVINARLPVPLLLLSLALEFLFHSMMIPYQLVDDVLLPLIMLASFFARLFKMTNFAAKHSIMTPKMVENFCNDYYIPDEVHPVAPGRDNTITQFPEGKVGVYTRFFDYCGYRIPFTKFLMAVLRYFRIHISQLSPFGAARVSHFEVLTRVLDLAPSVTVFRAFYTRTYSDGLFSFAKRSPSSPSCFPKPPDSIKNWSDHFFWVDAKVFPIPVSLLLENNKALFRRYPECFLCLVGLSPYYPFDENTYPAFERPDGTDMGLLDFIKTADPRKVQAVEVQKKDDQVKLLESTSHCFMPLVTPAAGGSSSAAAPEVSAPEVSAPAEVEPENVVPEDTYLDLTGPDEVVATQPGKSKRKRLGKQSDTLPAKQLRKDHPSFATGTGGKTLAGLRQLMPTSPLVSRPSFQADIQAHVVQSARITDVPVYTAAATVTSARENVGITPTSDVAGSSQLETSEGSDDSFYELPALNSAEAKRCMDYEQLYTEFNVGAARQICLESEVRSRAEHELELKEKLKGKYDARGRLLEEKDLEILILKSLLVEEAERAETAEVVRLRGQVSALTGEVSVLKSTVAQKDTDISLLDSRATYLNSALDDSKAAFAEAGSLITSLTSERDVSTLHTAFQDFKEKAEAQQEE